MFFPCKLDNTAVSAAIERMTNKFLSLSISLEILAYLSICFLVSERVTKLKPFIFKKSFRMYDKPVVVTFIIFDATRLLVLGITPFYGQMIDLLLPTFLTSSDEKAETNPMKIDP